MKKITSIILTISLLLACALSLVGCNRDSAKVMNLELNPKLEFVLDSNDKIVTVNALNDDGNQVLKLAIDSDRAFKNLTAEQGVELFLELSKDGGYLVTGSEEEIKIEVSGTAEELKNKLKDKAQAFFTENDLNVEIEFENISKEDIISAVNECMKEYTNTELTALNEQELLELLKTSRQETQDFLTQELKDAYYDLRAEKIKTAEIEEIIALIEELPNEAKLLMQPYISALNALKENVVALEDAYVEHFLSSESAYAQAKNAYLTAKQNYLDKRLELTKDGELTSAEKLILDGIESSLELTESALETAKDTAEGAIAIVKGVINSAIDVISVTLNQVKTQLETLGVSVKDVTEIAKQTKTDFKAYFTENEKFAIYVNVNVNK